VLEIGQKNCLSLISQQSLKQTKLLTICGERDDDIQLSSLVILKFLILKRSMINR